MTLAPSRIDHGNFVTTQNELQNVLGNAEPGAIVWLIGPTGAGKSELRRTVMRTLSGDPSLWGLGLLPAICTRACLTDRTKFNTKDLYSRLAKAVRQPNIDWLLPKNATPSEDFLRLKNEVAEASKYWQEFRLPGTEHGLREEFESTALHRGVRHVYLEEVHSVRQVHPNQSFSNHMTSLMQLAEEAQFVLVLIGSHLAESLWKANEEVLSRSIFVYLQRYGEKEKSDQIGFAEILKTAGKRFPLDTEDLLVKEIALMYTNSAGLIGRLFLHLKRANVLRSKLELPTITSDILRRSSGEHESLVNLWNYAREFDEFMIRRPATDPSAFLPSLWGISLREGAQ